MRVVTLAATGSFLQILFDDELHGTEPGTLPRWSVA